MPVAPPPSAERGRLAPRLSRLLLLPLSVLSIVSALLIWQVERLLSEEARVDQADLVLTRGNALYRLMVDQETGLRGYLLTGRDEFLDPYRAARDDVDRGLQALAASMAGEPLQAQVVERVREDHAAWQRNGDAAIRARAAGEHARPSVPEMLIGKDEMDHLRAELQVFLQGEEHLRRDREVAARREARATFGLGAAVLGLAAAAIAVGARRRILAIATSYRRAADAESRFRRLWDSNIIGVMYSNAGGTITGANDAMLRMIGYSHEDVDAGRVRWTAITPPDQLHLDDEHIAESRERGSCTPYEKAYVARDGRRVPVLLAYTLLDGTTDQYICVALDLTEQKRAEQAAAHQHELVRAITENATAALFMQDERGYCTFMNPAAETMTGYSFDELRRRPMHDVLHRVQPDGSPLPREECPILEAVCKRTRITNYETVFVHESGDVFPVLCSASPVSRTEGVYMVLEARDITEQKRIEHEREQLLDSERAARSAAERAARIKDEFLAVLSHELRTPLSAILGWASLLRKGTLDADAATRALEVIERNTRAEAQLVEDLLDVSRIAAGKVRLDARRVDPAEIVEVAVDSVRPAAEGKRIELSVAAERGAGPVLADVGRLQQVVWNLLTNAIKFTPKGGRVAVALRSSEDGHVEIAVSDDGQGIAREFLPFVFERFRQADSSTTRRHGGLGLGLALVRHLVELHGGTVRVDSEGEGRGATFTVSLPVAACRSAGWAVALDPCASIEGVRVLVVDDEPDARELVRRLLADCHAEVVAVESAREALDEVQRFRPDVLLSDIGMPQQDGYQLVRAIRALDEGRGGRTPAAALTAFARPEDRRLALHAGFQMHLAKPIDANELLTAVASLAGRAHAVEPSA